MFKQQINKLDMKNVETIIGPAIKVKGDFNGKGDIVIDGTLEGSLKTDGHLLVGDKARITANIKAGEARIAGEVTGNIKIEGYLELSSTAKIYGDIDCLSLAIEKGAHFNGKCVTQKTQSSEIEKNIEN